MLSLLDAAPLLKEEPGAGVPAGLPNRVNPVLFHRPCAGTALPTDDDPIDAALVQICAEHGKMDATSAKAFVKALRAQNRYQTDVY